MRTAADRAARDNGGAGRSRGDNVGMDPNAALGTAAQVAVTLAGFAGVVVVFGGPAVHQWSRVDRFRLRLMLNNALLALVFSLLGLLLLTTGLAPPAVWRWCSGVAAVLLVLSAIPVVRSFAGFGAGELEAAGGSRTVFFAIASVGVALTLLQIVNAAVLHELWPFFAVVVTSILAAMIQFLRLINNRRQAAAGGGG